MTAETPRLPQELVDHIIDHLYDDPLTLSNCSLTSRAWLPTSRLHIFAKIGFKVSPLHTVPPNELCKRLYHLLTASPDIIPNIRELEICEGSPIGGTASPGCSTTWVATERTLPPLLKILTNLQRLEFGSRTTMHWGLLPLPLQNAIFYVFGLPSLAYIRLKSWSFPTFSDLTELLSFCQNLKGLALSDTRVCGDTDGDGDGDGEAEMDHSGRGLELETMDSDMEGTRRCRLDFLTIDHVDFGYLGYWLLSARSTVEIKSLRELRVAHFYDVTAVERLLMATGSSLEHFHLKPGPWDVHSFDLGRNSGLRTIRLTFEDPSRAITWVKTLLSTLSPSNLLECIGIEFFTDIKKLEGWAELDALLVRPELGALRTVDIGLFASPTNAEFARVRGELQGLGARGVLRLYQLGIKSQRSSGQLTPRISRYEYSS
ncbi:hypothetical protein BDZ94DRAFT_1370405 [Collybia nuda]|uniref:F-box domain-containing protein n=1 Tax=Collybia nuda TaxID=64659 RepID=A0A9P6CBT2_9AGAR|nr:hypothetical protein BDZ94DRAFT_1370405 [Collybia nuda]